MPEILDKCGALDHLDDRLIDLGCGRHKRSPAHVGIDAIDYPGVDIVGDALDVLGRIATGAVAGLYSSHFLEHIDDLGMMLGEITRVVRPGGAVEIVVPHFSNPYYYSDPTHVRSFGLYTLSYLCVDDVFRRRVPQYSSPLPLRLDNAALGFKSSPPHYGRHAVKLLFGVIANATRWAKEFYEENLVYLMPCYEVRYSLTRLPSATTDT